MQAKGLCPTGDRSRDMAERYKAQSLAHQARDLRQHRPALRPTPVAHQLVLYDQPAKGCEDQRQRMISDLVDKGVGTIGDRDALLCGRLDIDRVDADAAERDDLAALEPVDHLFGNPPPLGVERVGAARGADELILGPRTNLEDLGVDRDQRLHLVSIIAGSREAGARGRRYPELGQNSLLLCTRSMPRITPLPAQVVNHPAPVPSADEADETAISPS